MLKQREVDHEALNEKRLEHLWAKKQAEKERYSRRLRSDHIKGESLGLCTVCVCVCVCVCVLSLAHNNDAGAYIASVASVKPGSQ